MAVRIVFESTGKEVIVTERAALEAFSDLVESFAELIEEHGEAAMWLALSGLAENIISRGAVH